MARGPAPTPTAIKKARGNPGKRPLNTREPAPPAKAPRPLASLSDEAKRTWRRLAKLLLGMGVLAEVDEAALAILCESYAAWQALIKQAREKGPIVNVNGQPVPNPYLVRADREAEKVRKMLSEFGLSPAARSRIALPDTGPKGELDEFLGAFPKLASA